MGGAACPSPNQHPSLTLPRQTFSPLPVLRRPITGSGWGSSIGWVRAAGRGARAGCGKFGGELSGGAAHAPPAKGLFWRVWGARSWCRRSPGEWPGPARPLGGAAQPSGLGGTGHGKEEGAAV